MLYLRVHLLQSCSQTISKLTRGYLGEIAMQKRTATVRGHLPTVRGVLHNCSCSLTIVDVCIVLLLA